MASDARRQALHTSGVRTVPGVAAEADEDDAEPSSPRPAGLAARELQAKLAASRAGAGGGGGHQRLKGLLKGGSFKSKGAAAAAAPHRRAPPQPQQHPGLPAAQQLPAAHEAAPRAQPHHRSDQLAAPWEQHILAAAAQSAVVVATTHSQQQQRPPQQRPAAPRASPAKSPGQDPRLGGRPANRSAPGNSHAAEAAGQQRRPTAQRSIKRRDAGTVERFEREVLAGRLWHPPCQAANTDLPDALPDTFPSVEQYVASFEALLLEEAREAVREEWGAKAAMGKAYEADVLQFEELGGGWHAARLQTRRSAEELPREGHLVALSLGRPPQGNPLDFVARHGGGGGSGRGPKRQRLDANAPAGVNPAAPAGDRGAADAGTAPIVAGIVRGVKRSGEVVVNIFPVCASHQHDPAAPCRSVVGDLRQTPKGWFLVPVGQLTTQQREYTALHRAAATELLESLLAPERLALAAEAAADAAYVQRAWPPEAAQRPFIEYLRSQYDATQLRAIEFAAAHLGSPAPQGMPPVPFVLIQGPPGTGKTHTVKGVLNVWHLVAYQRFYEALVARLTPEPEELSHRPSGTRNLMAEIQAQMASAFERRLAELARKPRILVCAPSNAAADELLQRVMDDGFADGGGHVYRPSVVRIGSDQAPMAERARDVWVDGLIAQLTGLPQQLWQHKLQLAQAEAARLSREIGTMQAAMRAGDVDPSQLARRVASQHEARDRALLLMERLQLVEPLVNRQPGANLRNIQDNLEASFVSEAEMVFTTLSSTGRKVFERLGDARFETVLIDEAAQATELANLQAFAFGCKQVVLVGDPKQLPATVKSLVAQKLSLARSLFERLQGGAPAAAQMLSVQYRMHPFIREFPSRYFYDNALQDGPNVRDTAPEVFYEAPLLKPYVFFDVAAGREAGGGGGSRSKTNREEADLAAALFGELRGVLLAAAAQGRLKRGCAVGVITFYKAQVGVLRAAFRRAVGDAAAKEVMIETVDSFQGKQLDVVILSCVRASAESGGRRSVGFVSDLRRLNVAITRAKRALWVCGNAATLRCSEVWDALVEDATQRGVLIEDASARSLFPDQQPFDQQQAQQQAKSHQQQAQQQQQQQQPHMQQQQAQHRQPPPTPPPSPQQQQQPPPQQQLPTPQRPAQQAAAPAEVSDPRRAGPGTAKPAAAPSDPRRRAEQQPAAPADPRQRPAVSAAAAAGLSSAAASTATGRGAVAGKGAPSSPAADVPAAEAAASDMPRSYSPPLAGATAPPAMPRSYSPPPPVDQTPSAAQQQEVEQQPPGQPLHGSQQRKRRGRDSDGRSQQPRGICISVGMAPPQPQQQRRPRHDKQPAVPGPEAATTAVEEAPATGQGAAYQLPSSPESGELPEATEAPATVDADAGGHAEPQPAAAFADSSRDGAGGAPAAPLKQRELQRGQHLGPSLLPVQPAKQLHRGQKPKQRKHGKKRKQRPPDQLGGGAEPLRYNDSGTGPTFFDELGLHPASAPAADGDMMAKYAAALDWDDENPD